MEGGVGPERFLRMCVRRSRGLVLGLVQHSQLRPRENLGPWTIHEEVFEDELAIASLERGTAMAAYDLAIWQRACLGTNKLVLGTAIWAVEAERF